MKVLKAELNSLQLEKLAKGIVLEAAEGRPIVVDAVTYGTIYPIMHGTRT